MIQALWGLIAAVLLAPMLTDASDEGQQELLSPAVRVQAELARLRQGVTLDTWLKTHVTDVDVLYSHRLKDPLGGWCARATLHDTLSGLVRHAYFYPPAHALGDVLPASELGSALVRTQCLLGAIRVHADMPDMAAAMDETDELISQLRKEHGAEQPLPARYQHRTPAMRALPLAGSRDWWPRVFWQTEAAVVLAALVPATKELPDHLLGLALQPAAVAAQSNHRWSRDGRADQTLAFALRAAQLAGSDVPAENPLVRLIAHHKEWNAGRAERLAHATVDAALTAWIRDASELAPTGRAAALLLADLVLTLRGGTLQMNDADIRARYESYGATFVYTRLGRAHVYSRGLMRAAIDLVPEGPVADLAALTRFDRGLDDTGMCGNGDGNLREVIATGEPFVAGLSAPTDRAYMHFLLAQAHADYVGLADGAQHHAPAQGYADMAAESRARALAHYRLGLALDSTSAEAGHAYGQAWRLLAGLPPLHVRFYCFYD